MANSKLLVSLRFQYHLINTSVKGDSLSPIFKGCLALLSLRDISPHCGESSLSAELSQLDRSCLRLVSCNPTTNHPHRKELIPWQLFLSVPPYWMLWCSPALHRATPTAMNSPTKSKACFQSQSPHSIPFCGDCKKTNTYKPMTSPIKGETAGITTSPMPDGRLWKPTAPSGSSTNNKLTNF